MREKGKILFTVKCLLINAQNDGIRKSPPCNKDGHQLRQNEKSRRKHYLNALKRSSHL